MNCPLCESDKIRKLDVLNKNDLIKLYKKFTTVDFSYLIDQNITYYVCKKCKLKYYDPPTVGDEIFYNALQKFDWYYMDEKSEYTEVSKYIKSEDKVLDVGSGKGAFAKCISTKKYIGLDPSKKAKDMAKKNGITIENEMIQDYAKQYQNHFDVVVSFQVLEHVLEPNVFLEAKIKALKHGGRLIVAVPSESSFLKYVSNGILNMPPHHVTRWSDDTLKFIASKYNLDLLKIHHEDMQEVHELWFLDTLVQNSIMKMKLVDVSVIRKIVSLVAHIFARILVRGAQKELLPKGHTVIAIYEKK